MFVHSIFRSNFGIAGDVTLPPDRAQRATAERQSCVLPVPGAPNTFVDKRGETLIIREGLQKKIRNYLGIFPNIGGGGLLIPKTFVILTIALKTPLKHLKITQKFPTLPKKIGKKWSKFPKGGGGGGVRHLGKIPKKFRIFFLRGSLNL